MLAFGREFAKRLQLPAVIELIGDVGAGKTTFTRGLAEGLGVNTELSSPSFTISRRYAFSLNSIAPGEVEPETGELIHYDFYRLDDPGIMRSELAEALGDKHSVLVVEWGENVADLLPAGKHRLEISLEDDGSREVLVSGPLASEFMDFSVENLCKTCEKLPKSSGKTTQSCAKDQDICAKPVQNLATTSGEPVEKPQIKLYLDTSTDRCVVRLNNKEYVRVGKYDLAEKLPAFLRDCLSDQGATWQDLSEITFFSGPGSFTGLRIGATIVNTLAHELKIPLYDHHGQKHQIILPDYGRPANISTPKK